MPVVGTALRLHAVQHLFETNNPNLLAAFVLAGCGYFAFDERDE